MNMRLPHASRPLFARLQREWQAINRRPAVLRRAAGWNLGIPFRSLDDIVTAAGYWSSAADRAAGGCAAGGCNAGRHVQDGNEVLGRLLLAARTDDVAGRVVLQRLLPGLVACSRRWGGHRRGGSVDAFDELLSAVWVIIREFPVERRRGNLAGKLLRDAEHRAFGRAGRRMMVVEVTAPHLLDVPMEAVVLREPSEELAEVVACARSLSEYDLQLIELFAQGRSMLEVAAALDVSERTVRNHRDAVVHRLRAAVAA